MMPYDQWLARIIEAAQNVASRKFQQEAWFPGGAVVSSPEEICLTLFEDYTFELFCQTYGASFTREQQETSRELKTIMERYYDALPRHADPLQVLDDPQWELVRQSARKFLQAFGGALPSGAE